MVERQEEATSDELLQCSFSMWGLRPEQISASPVHHSWMQSRSFKFSPHVIKSRILHCPDIFLKYLSTDGIVLPELDKDDDTDDRDDSLSPEEHNEFKAFDDKIREAIAELDGHAGGVFPKLNWSAPTDAKWINAGNIQCFRPGDVYLVMKASDRVVFDLDYSLPALRSRLPPIVVLRKWANLHPSMEFRCFVCSNTLVGTSH